MRILIGFLLLLLCVLVAFLLTKKFTLKKEFYKSFEAFNTVMIQEVCFGKKTLISVIENTKCDNDFYRLLSDRFAKNISPQEKDYLSKEENLFFVEYCNNLGKTDGASQNEFLSKADKNIKEQLSKSIEEEKNKKTLYLKLGFMLGLILLIIVI